MTGRATNENDGAVRAREGDQYRTREQDRRFLTKFRGCTFDDGWEFDQPCVIYYPIFAYSETGRIEEMVEDICIDHSLLQLDVQSRQRELEIQCEWRGWSMHGFRRRKAARHVEYVVEWAPGDTGDFEMRKARSQSGPFSGRGARAHA